MKTRRRSRRTTARRAPMVRRCPCNGAREPAKERIAGGLMIGGARDPAEAAADARVDRALAKPPPVRRKCAACEAEEVRRNAPAPKIAPAASAAPASMAARFAVDRLGPGRPLSRAERGFFEPRLGADFSGVRLHEDAAADRASRAMDAAAFTLGRDIAFARGESARTTVLAHELAHVAEEGTATTARRLLRVHEPDKKIPPKKGPDKGLDQTNAKTVQTYLDELCENGAAKVASSGKVETDEEECVYPDKPSVGCDCICELDDAPVTVSIHVRDKGMPQKTGFGTSPHTIATEVGGQTGKGAGSDVIVPSPNDSKEYGYADVSGVKQTLANWEILGHELCGHALLNARGTHPFERPTQEVRHGHETVVAMENAIRNDKGITNRDRGVGAAAPYCGESFSRDKGAATFEDKSARHLDSCRTLRAFYLHRLKQARKKMPPDERANLTPLKRKYAISEPLPRK